MPLPIEGGVIGHYTLEEPLGEGGWAIVYRAVDLRLGRTVAIKILREAAFVQEADCGSLLREARLAASLAHPHICMIFDVDEDKGRAYIAMEYIEGLTLKDLVPEDGLPIEQVSRYGLQIADALAYAHLQGVIHGDLKSSNVLVAPEGGMTKLVDFGLGRRLRAEEIRRIATSKLSLAEVGRPAGTLTYAAPEVLSGKPTSVQTDIWGFGVLLHEMATGQFPFRGQTAFELGLAIMTGQRDASLPRVQHRLHAIIDRCLEKEPGCRYQSAREILHDLEELPGGLALETQARPSWRLRRVVLQAALAATVFLILLFVIPTTRTVILRQHLRPRSVPNAVSSPGRANDAGGSEIPRAPTASNPHFMVWVNTKSGVYHCPDSVWYGQTKEGRYMTEAQAQENRYRPAVGKVCQ